MSAPAPRVNERLNLALFGNMYNAAHFLGAAHHHRYEIIALCNPDQRKFAAMFQRWKELARDLGGSSDPRQRAAALEYERLASGTHAKMYGDIRRMFEEISGQIDVLVVSETDHLHAVACGLALRAGKPVCSERPLGLTIDEARSLRALAAQTGLPTVYRSPGTSSSQFRRALELVEEGAIGQVREAHTWFTRGGPDRDALPRGPAPPPEGLDWDSWLGPLPWREFHPDWMTYAHWRETSNGGLGVFGPHTTIFPFLALNLPALWKPEAPQTAVEVTAECSSLNRLSFPRWERVRWKLPPRGKHPELTLTWHHGPELPPGSRADLHEKLREFEITDEAEADTLMGYAGSLLVGSDGAIAGDDHSVKITGLPQNRFAPSGVNRPLRLPSSDGLYADWLNTIRGGEERTLAHFDHGGPLSELLMLGSIATQFPGETLSYEPWTGRIIDHPEAANMTRYTYRDGWRI